MKICQKICSLMINLEKKKSPSSSLFFFFFFLKIGIHINLKNHSNNIPTKILDLKSDFIFESHSFYAVFYLSPICNGFISADDPKKSTDDG